MTANSAVTPVCSFNVRLTNNLVKIFPPINNTPQIFNMLLLISFPLRKSFPKYIKKIMHIITNDIPSIDRKICHSKPDISFCAFNNEYPIVFKTSPSRLISPIQIKHIPIPEISLCVLFNTSLINLMSCSAFFLSIASSLFIILYIIEFSILPVNIKSHTKIILFDIELFRLCIRAM